MPARPQKRSLPYWLVGVAAVGLFLSMGAQAQTDLPGETWRWAHFTTECGLPANEVYDVVESGQGTVWAATSKGVAWYDGFRWHGVGEEAGLPGQRPASLAIDEQGGVLVVSGGGLFQGDQRGFRRLPAGQDSLLNIRAAVPFGEGVLLLADSSLYLYKYHSKGLRPWALPEVEVGLNPSLFRSRAGTIWLGASSGVFRWQEGTWVPEPAVAGFFYLAEDSAGVVVLAGVDRMGKRGLWEGVSGGGLRHNPREGEDLVTSLAMGPDGEVLVAYDSGAIRVRRNSVWSSLQPVPPPLQNPLFVRFRGNGDLWVGTEEGLFLHRASSRRWIYWSHEERGVRNRVHEILRTREGAVWVATGEGVEVHRPDGSAAWIDQVLGTRLGVVTALEEDREGGVWIASGSSFAGAYRWDGKSWRHFGADQGLEASRVHKIRKDRRGRLWFLGMAGVGEEREPGAFAYEDGRFTRWGREEGLIHGRVYTFAEGGAGELWFGTRGGLSRWQEGTWRHWTGKEGLREERIFALAIDGTGRLWFADQQNGLGFIDASDRPRYLTTADGLVHDEVWDLRVDPQGRLWVATQGGLAGYRDGGWLTFRTRHGLSNNRLWPVLPAEDRVYVGTRANGVCVLNLEEESQPPPQVVLSHPAIKEDQVQLRWQVFPWWGQSPAEELETRHCLDRGEWSAWGRQREVELGGLSSGSHTFQVQVRGLFGSFAPEGGELSFEIPVPLHRHPYFVVPLGVLLGAAVGLGIAFALRRRRYTEQRRFLLTSARCLLWHARVEEREGAFVWDIEVADEEAAQEFLPLQRSPGQSYTDAWHQSKLPEDRSRMDETSSAALRSKAPGYSQEYRCRQADGQVRWLSEDVRIRPFGLRRWRLAGVCIEVTERKRMEAVLRAREETLRQITTAAQDAIVMMDPQGKVSFWNGTAEEIFGYAAAEVLGRPLHDLLTPERFRPAFRQAFPHFQQTGEGAAVDKTLELVGLRQTGEEFPLEVSLASVELEDGWHAIGIARDITGRKQAEEALRAAKQEAEEANQAKSTFLANMSHEIRTPMNAVVGFAELLAGTALDATQREYVHTVRSSAHALLGLINDILDFSKIEAGQLEMERMDFRLHDVLEETADLFREKVAETGVELIVAIADGTPDALVGDPFRLRQVLVNLTGNALKFTEAGEVEIRVEPVAVEPEEAGLRFAVRDTGIGIPADKIDRLFAPFIQADGSTTRRYGGTGLGLAVSRQLVELMGGQIGAESREGAGSTFHFTAIFGRSTAAAPEPALSPDLQGLKVLVVDDNQANRTVMQQMVESLGPRVEAAASGAAGLEVLRQQARRGDPFDLVLLDWRMPEMDGMELARRIKEEAGLPAVRMVMMTAFGRDAEEGQAQAIGIDAFLVKPIKQSLLRETLQGVISGGRREPRSPVLAGAPDRRPLAGVRLLLAEDNPVNQRLARIVLEKAGYVVEVAGNGREAVEAARARGYDAVLMDVQMPEMDGYEATRQIRREFADLPIIAMTASAMKGDRELCLEAGMDDYVSKPIDREELFDALQRWIGRKGERAKGSMGDGEPPPGCPANRGAWEHGRMGDGGLPPGRPASRGEWENGSMGDGSMGDRGRLFDRAGEEWGTGVSAVAPVGALPASLPGIDLSEVMERLGGDEGFLRELLADFAGQFGGAIGELRQALKAGDGDLVRRLVHTLKGAAGNLSIKGVQAAARELEEEIGEGGSDSCEERLAQVEQALAQVLAAIGELAPWEGSDRGGSEGPQRVPDREGLAILLQLLRDRLRERDPVAAASGLEEVGAQLAGTGLEGPVRRLARQIDDFDFGAAQETLQTIARALEVPLG